MPTFPLTFPTNKEIAEITFSPQSVVGVTRSPFTGQQQVQVHSGQWWKIEVALPVMKRADAEEFNAFLLRLNGREGTFLLGDPKGQTPRGAAKDTPGTPVVKGGSQTGDTLTFDGAPAGTSGYLLAGDYIQLGTGSSTHLHKVLVDADADSIGDVTVEIWPKLRESPSNNDTVVVSNTKGLFRLETDQLGWGADPIFYQIAFSAIEAL